MHYNKILAQQIISLTTLFISEEPKSSVKPAPFKHAGCVELPDDSGNFTKRQSSYRKDTNLSSDVFQLLTV